MEHLLAGRSAAAVFPTGGGKSLCYQLPALLLPGLTLVVSPLIALMKDQIDALTARGISAARLDSTLDKDQYQSAIGALRSGDLRLLYVAPERFNNERFREMIAGQNVSLFAVDEAHCISEWGHNFRPDYLKLAEFARRCGAERLLALTATATDSVLADICREFNILPEASIRTGFYRPNLTLRLTSVESSRRDELLIERIQTRPAGAGIVYVTLQKTAEQLADRLQRAGFDARAYHAGMNDEIRAEVQDWFMQGEARIVVATIAFGMGIDKRDIRYVDHYNLPKSLENYSQEIGRAGRDGQPSQCEVFAVAEDLNVLENFIFGDTPTESACESLVREMFSLGPEFDVSYYELSSAHDIRMLVIRTLITYLELDGYLRGGTPFYSTYQFQPLASSAKILGRFEGERREFLANIFRSAKKGHTWFTLDVDGVATKLNVDRQRIIRALDYLGEQNLLTLKVAGVRNRFERLKTPSDLAAVAHSLYSRMRAREQREVARLNQIVELVELDGCQVGYLAAYFGQKLPEACGHCSWCESRQSSKLPDRPEVRVKDDFWQQALRVRGENRAVLSDARMLARFLCGLSLPRLVKTKLTKHELFGSLEGVPFMQVLEHTQQISGA
jgi:ATP-dependent DNA helicase RecQ